jgi:hypothetical protein
MSESIDNEIIIIKKQEFTTSDGREWFCALDGDKPVGQVQVTYNLNDMKFTYNGEWKGNLQEGYFEGYGVLSNSDGRVLTGTFKKGKFHKGTKKYGPSNIHESFEGECFIDENTIVKKYNGLCQLKNGTLIWKEDNKKYTGTFYENGNINKGSYQWENDDESFLGEGTFYNNKDKDLKEGTREFKYKIKKKSRDKDTKTLRKIFKGTFSEENRLVTGKITDIEKSREWLYEWKDNKRINTKLTFIEGEYEKSTLDGVWETYKIKKWKDGKNIEIMSSETKFKKGTKILYKNSKNFLKIKGVFNNCTELDSKDCIEGNIEYTDLKDRYFVKGKIKNTKFYEGKIMFNNNLKYSEYNYKEVEGYSEYDYKDIEGSFYGMKDFKKGKITFKNLSELEGEFKLNFKKSYQNKIIKANGIMIVSDAKYHSNWYFGLFKSGIHSLIKKMIKKSQLFPNIKINFCKKKLKTKKDEYSLKILMLKGEWNDNKFTKGEIKYTYLDGEDHLVILDNGRFEKKAIVQIKQEPEISRNSNVGNSSSSSSSGSKRSLEDVKIKQENENKRVKK